MSKKRGFTFAELIVVIAILGILLSISVQPIGSAVKYTQKNLTNTMHKVLIGAVDGWVKDNYDATQRPDNFFSKNSQGNFVYHYINNSEIFQNTNLSLSGDVFTIGPKENDKVFVQFEKGVLTSEYIIDSSKPSVVKFVFGIYDLTTDKSAVQDYEQKKRSGYIVGDTYKEVGQP